MSNKVESSYGLPTMMTADVPILTSDEISELTAENPEVTLKPLAQSPSPDWPPAAAGSRLSILGNPDPASDPSSVQDEQTEADSTTTNDNSGKSLDGKKVSAIMTEEKAVIIDILTSDKKQKPLHPKKGEWQSFEGDDAMNNSDNYDLLDTSQKWMQAKSEDPYSVSLSSEKKLRMGRATTTTSEELDSTKMEIPEHKQVAGEVNVEGLQEEKRLEEKGCQDLWHNLKSCSHQIEWKNCQVSIQPLHLPSWTNPPGSPSMAL